MFNKILDLFFPALFHLLTKKQKKVLTRTLNQHESGSKNTFNDYKTGVLHYDLQCLRFFQYLCW